MMRHLNVVHAGHARDAAPLRDAAGDGGVYVEDIDRAGVYEVAATEPRNLALSGIDRNAAGVLADQREPLQLVIPLDRFFEPANVVILDQAAKLDGLVRSP